MNMEETTPVEEETTGTESPEIATTTEETEGVESPEATEEVIEEGEVATEAPKEPEFTPNLVYNFRKEQRTIPEKFKEFIKDEETNNMVKELYEKADAMDFMKQGREMARQELAQLKEAVTPKLQQLEDTQYFLEKGDVSSALKVSGFSKDHIIDEAIRLLEEQNNPSGPRQADAIQQRELERQNQALQSQIQSQQYMQVNSEFEQATTDHAHVINAYDSKFGQDSFKAMVAQYGQQQERQGRQLSISDAVREVASNLSELVPAATPAPTEGPAQSATVHNINNQRPKTFPKVTRNTSSSTSSPVAKNIKSFDDLVNYSKNYKAN